MRPELHMTECESKFTDSSPVTPHLCTVGDKVPGARPSCLPRGPEPSLGATWPEEFQPQWYLSTDQMFLSGSSMSDQMRSVGKPGLSRWLTCIPHKGWDWKSMLY